MMPKLVTRYKRVSASTEDQSRWTLRTLAAELKLPASTVHAMLVAAKLQPHRVRTFTFSPDPDFEAKLLDIVGLYLNPSEKSRPIERLQPETIAIVPVCRQAKLRQR
jgi:hypothetical protein